MYTDPPKKMLIVNILDILKKYTDADHTLTQKDICCLLEKEYGMKLDRKAVKRNIQDLIDSGFNINYTESVRETRDKNGKIESSAVMTDFYYERDFSDSELHLLIDSILFSRYIPPNQCKELADKLAGLSNKYFSSRISHIQTLPSNRTVGNKQLFYTIEILDEAISSSKQVSFMYGTYHTDRNLYPRLDKNGIPRLYIINPYQIVAANGRYYLVCNNDKYDNVANYRLDFIMDIKLLDTKIKPATLVKGLERGVDVSKIVYMFTGEKATVSMRINKTIINDVIDWFGDNAVFYDETQDEVCVRMYVTKDDVRRWALQYALNVTVLSPPDLAEQVKQDLEASLKRYGNDPNS